MSGASFADDLEVVADRRVVGEQCGNRLAGVDHATAAERQDDVAPLAPRERRALFHERDGRLGRDTKCRRADMLLAKLIDERLGASAPAFHDERARAHAGGELRRVVRASFAKDDSRRRGELEVHATSLSAWQLPAGGIRKTARYFTLRRGSAIIGSTASRHVR